LPILRPRRSDRPRTAAAGADHRALPAAPPLHELRWAGRRHPDCVDDSASPTAGLKTKGRRVARPAFKYSGALAGRLATIKRADYASHFLLPLTTNACAWNETSCNSWRRRRARCQVIRDISPGCVLYLTELYFSGMKEIDIAIHNQCIKSTDLAQAIIPVPGFMCVTERPHNTPLLSSNKDGVSSKTGRPHAMHDSLMRKVHYDHCLARIAS